MNLLSQITHCPIVEECLAKPDSDHPCWEIVRSQKQSLENFQVPEPWSGHIRRAPILFIGSNPSISKNECFPRWVSWSDNAITGYFENRFPKFIEDGKRSRRIDGSFGKATHSWAEIKNRAKELVKPQKVKPGFHYAVTDIVHCKSKREKGLSGAIKECPRRYLKRILRMSGARVVVILGSTAKQVVLDELKISPKARLYGPTRICGRRRWFVFMPRPGSSVKRKFSNCLSKWEIKALCEFLESGRVSNAGFSG